MSGEAFFYTEVGLIAAYALSLAAIAGGWLPVTPARLKLAQYCFYVVAALIAVVAIIWGSQTDMAFLPRNLIVGALCAVAGIAAAQTGRFLSGANSAQAATAPEKPSQTGSAATPPAGGSTNQSGGQTGGYITNNGPVFNAPVTISPPAQVHHPHTTGVHKMTTPPEKIDNRGGIYNAAPNQGSQTIINNGPPRDPNGLYQGDLKIGGAQGDVKVDVAGGVIAFQVLRFSDYPDPAVPLEYRDFFIQCDAIPRKNPNEIVGQLSAMVVGANCKIVGRK